MCPFLCRSIGCGFLGFAFYEHVFCGQLWQIDKLGPCNWNPSHYNYWQPRNIIKYNFTRIRVTAHGVFFVWSFAVGINLIEIKVLQDGITTFQHWDLTCMWGRQSRHTGDVCGTRGFCNRENNCSDFRCSPLFSSLVRYIFLQKKMNWIFLIGRTQFLTSELVILSSVLFMLCNRWFYDAGEYNPRCLKLSPRLDSWPDRVRVTKSRNWNPFCKCFWAPFYLLWDPRSSLSKMISCPDLTWSMLG